ncbi:hypothetical protein ABZ379_29425 [Streptomyces canus]|uniref:hypothetical protein n=1 Tax=Streptomyces canus TaxID=58343 RepID=UPI0033CE93FD
MTKENPWLGRGHVQDGAVVHEPDTVLLKISSPGSLAQEFVQVPDLQLRHGLVLSPKSPPSRRGSTV